MPVRLLLDAAGGLANAVRATGVGGLGGVWLSAEEARAAEWSTPSLSTYGGSLGPGVIHVLDPGSCPLEHVDALLRYAAGETAGQCGPCMFGLPVLATEWRALVARPSAPAVRRMHERAELLRDRGACRFPDGIAGFVGSAARVFRDELEHHAAGR